MGNASPNRSRPNSIYLERDGQDFVEESSQNKNNFGVNMIQNDSKPTHIDDNNIDSADVELQIKFHDVHGQNILLSQGQKLAARNEKSFCDAIVFTHRPIRVYEKVFFKIVRLSSLWNGMIRFGFTSVDPENLRSKPTNSLQNEDDYDLNSPYNLPKYVYPTLTNKKGYWAGALGNDSILKENDVIYFYVNFEGEIHYGINHKPKGKFLDGVDVYGEKPPTMQPLWAIFDIYGNTLGIELVDFNFDFNNNNNIGAKRPTATISPSSESNSLGVSVSEMSNNLRTLNINHRGTIENTNSLPNSINSTGSSTHTSVSSTMSSTSNASTTWAMNNSAMTTMIPNRHNNINQNHDLSQTEQVSVVMRNRAPRQQETEANHLDRLLISCRRLCVDNHLNQTLHNSILDTDTQTNKTSSPQTKLIELNSKIQDFYQSIPILLHDTSVANRSISYKFMGKVHGKNVKICQPDCLIAYRDSSIAQLKERHNSSSEENSRLITASSNKKGPTKNAYVFLDRPVEKGKYFCIQIVGLDQSSNEAIASLGIGCSTCKPVTLNPKIDLPDDSEDLLDRKEYWVVLKNIFNQSSITRKHQVSLADELCFRLDETNGNLNFFINSNLVTECLFNVDLTQQLYFFFDLCGKINAIRLIPQCQSNGTVFTSLNSSTGLKKRPESALIDYFKSQLIDEQEIGQFQKESKELKPTNEECRICWDAPIECVFYSCGHMCLCWNCATALKKQSSKRSSNNPNSQKTKTATCPICRLEIIDIIRFFKS